MEFYTKRTPRARREHKCEFCGKKIMPGDTYSYEIGKYEGEFFDRRLCLICKNMLDRFTEDMQDDEFDWDWVEEWLNDKHCCECQNRSSCETSSKQCEMVRQAYRGGDHE